MDGNYVYAWFDSQMETHQSCRIRNTMSVYTSKLIAVLQGLRCFNENIHKEEKSVLIMTENRSLVDLFRTFIIKSKINNVVKVNGIFIV